MFYTNDYIKMSRSQTSKRTVKHWKWTTRMASVIRFALLEKCQQQRRQRCEAVCINHVTTVYNGDSIH